MCINKETSITAFGIGLIASAILMKQNKTKYYIGLFILFVSFIQLFEATLYIYPNVRIIYNLLLLNLGMHGLVFGLLFRNVIHISKKYMFLWGIIAIYIITKILLGHVDGNKNKTYHCTRWDFMTKDIVILLTLMYITMFYVSFQYENVIANKVMYMFVMLLLLTLIFSYVIYPSYENTLIINRPSMWCLTSALVSVIMIFTK